MLGCNQNMNFGEEKTFCFLSCVRINKQNRQSLNNIPQMLENITENPTKIILKSSSIYVPGWVGIISSTNEIEVINQIRHTIFAPLSFYHNIICTWKFRFHYIDNTLQCLMSVTTRLRLRYLNTGGAGCQVSIFHIQGVSKNRNF